MDLSDEQIVEQLMGLSHRVRHGGRTGGRRSDGLGGANGFVLRYLYENGSAFPTELRDALGVTTPRVTAILNDLEGRGLVVRTAAEDDHRRVSVSLTDEGRRTIEGRLSEARAAMEALVARIGHDDALALVRVLRAVEQDGASLPF